MNLGRAFAFENVARGGSEKSSKTKVSNFHERQWILHDGISAGTNFVRNLQDMQ